MSFLLNIDPCCYGLKHDVSGLTIGKVPVQIKKDVLHIQTNKFNLTKGLIELLTKRKPQDFNDEDIQSYKRILMLTNTHMRKYRNVYRLKPNSSWKYLNIISKLFPPKRKSRRVKMYEEEGEEKEKNPAENVQVLPCGKNVSPAECKVQTEKEFENSSMLTAVPLPLDNYQPTLQKMVDKNKMLEWDSETEPNDVVEAIKINSRLRLDYSIYIHTLRDMGIIE